MRGSGKEFPFFKGKVKLIQPEEHKVSVDLVIFLSQIREVRKNSKVVDLGAGFGFLSVVLAKKFGCRVHAIERNKMMLELLKENIKLNGLEDLILPVEADVRRLGDLYRRGEFDVAVSNPPFFPKGYGKDDGGFHFESDTGLRDFVKAGSYLLRDGGYFNILIPSFRLYELFISFRELNLPPRFMSLVYPNCKKKAKLAVVSSIRNVPGPLEIGKAIFINELEGGYTQEVERLLESFL